VLAALVCIRMIRGIEARQTERHAAQEGQPRPAARPAGLAAPAPAAPAPAGLAKPSKLDDELKAYEQQLEAELKARDRF